LKTQNFALIDELDDPLTGGIRRVKLPHAANPAQIICEFRD
jgi:hypothetical protein